MGKTFEQMSQINEIILSKFREAGALSKNTAKSLSNISLSPKENPDQQIGLRCLKGMWYIRRYKNLYYLDENALSNPRKTFFKKMLVLYPIIFLIMMTILGVIVVLDEYGII